VTSERVEDGAAASQVEPTEIVVDGQDIPDETTLVKGNSESEVVVQ